MFEIQRIPGDMEAFVLRDGSSGAEATVVPERGGLVTRFRAAGREILYLDPATLADRDKNVRGGIPVLFPIAGRLTGGAYRAGDATYALRQHGFARNLPFTVARSATRDRAEVTVSLAAGDATRALFPWDFELELTYAVSGQTLSIEQAITARGPGPMPLHIGYHPYFAISDIDKPRARISTDATRAFDNTTARTESFAGFDLTRPEVDLHLLDHRARETTLSVDGRPVVTLQMDPAFTTLVVWTLAGKDFVCIEPWTAPGDAMNTGAGLIQLAPGATHRAGFRIIAGGAIV